MAIVNMNNGNMVLKLVFHEMKRPSLTRATNWTNRKVSITI